MKSLLFAVCFAMKSLLFAVCFAWHAHAIGSDWLFLRDPDSHNWVKVVDGSHASFRGPKLEFEYLIARERMEDRKPGAILVRVVRKYDPGWGKKSDLRARTNLTRNEFPQKDAIKDDDVQRALYYKYHINQIENLILRHKFHAKIPPDEHTNQPTQKRTSFLFIDPYEGQTTHRAYLLYYSGIDSSGSRIPFYVGICDAFEKIAITVVELDPPIGVGLIPRRTELIKK